MTYLFPSLVSHLKSSTDVLGTPLFFFCLFCLQKTQNNQKNKKKKIDHQPKVIKWLSLINSCKNA